MPGAVVSTSLDDALEDMHDADELFLGKYQLYSGDQVARRTGGQGMVAFARWPAGNRDVAIKVCVLHPGLRS